jgi:hypothetical protein
VSAVLRFEIPLLPYECDVQKGSRFVPKALDRCTNAIAPFFRNLSFTSEKKDRFHICLDSKLSRRSIEGATKIAEAKLDTIIL